MLIKQLFIVVFCLGLNVFPLQHTSLEIVVVDKDSAVVSNVTARLKLSDDKIVKEIINQESGELVFTEIRPGDYILEIEVIGFKSQTQEIKIKDGKNRIVVNLQIAEIVEKVLVERDKQEKALDPREGAFSNFLTRDEIESLPDDPKELEKELRRRFGEDAIIQVDGFTSGNLPPKSQIASIRISRSSFDAEYHQIGNTVVSVTSRAGGGHWSGSISFNFNDGSFNARNPFALERSPNQQKNLNFFFSGPIINDKTSLFVSAFGNSFYRQENIIAALPNKQIKDSVRSTTNFLYPWVKISHNLSKSRTLNISYNGRVSNSENLGVGGFDLTERAFNSKNLSHQLQFLESGYVGKRFLNEIRFQFTDENLKTTPASDKTAIVVLDAFNAGGAGNFSRSHRQNFWLADNLLFGLGKIHALKIGGIFELEKRNLQSRANENGTFTFSSLNDYILGNASTFTQSAGTRNVNLSQIQIGAFIQDDIRLRRSLMLSLGLRYEWQNNLKDNSNFSPRVGFTWSPYKNGKMTFRGGAGLYYDWLGTNNLARILSRGILQLSETIIINPNFPNPLQSGTNQILPPSYWQKAADLKNPSIFLASIGVERQLNKNTSLRALYKFQKGVHQFRSRDTNAPVNFARPNPDFGRIVQVESSGFFAQNSLNVELNGRLSKTLSFAADYTLSKIISDNDGIFGLPSDNYNLRLDRSVSSLDQRHRLYASMYWRIRKDLRFSTIFSAASGLPYTITTGRDENGDTIFNDRPVGVGRNSARGAWQRQFDMSLGWTIGLGKRGGKSNSPGMIVITSDEAAGGDFGSDTKHKYSLKLSVTARNVFNQPNFTSYVGVETSPFFRQPVAADSPRRIELGLRFSY